jgi:tRNA(fMet)-specific endonuclease VapC
VDALIFDTTFLIDVQRERAKAGSEAAGPAHAFLEQHGAAIMQIPSTVLGEFAEGFADRDDPILQAVLDHCEILAVDRDTALMYGAVARDLRARGELIGTNDLWIAAAALRHGRALVTRNQDHFRRVPDLEILTY